MNRETPIFALAGALQKANTHLRRLIGQQAKRHGLQAGDMYLICALGTDGAQRMCDLAETVAVSPPSLTRMVARLEDLGTVSRRRSPVSEREVLVELTERGSSLFDSCYPAACAALRRHVARHLSADEQRELLQLAARLAEPAQP